MCLITGSILFTRLVTRLSLGLSLGLILALTGCISDPPRPDGVTALDTNTLAIKHTYRYSDYTNYRNRTAEITTTQSIQSIPAIPKWWLTFHDPLLNQLIATAFIDSPTMQRAMSRIQQAQAITQAVRSRLWPSVDFSTYVQREYFSKYGLVPPPFNGQTFTIGDIGLNFNYEFDFWGKNKEQLAAQQQKQIAILAEVAAAELVLSTAIANTYFQLQHDQAIIGIQEEIANQCKQIQAIMLARKQHGIDSDVPLKTADLNVQTAKLQLDQAKQIASNTRHGLAILLGNNPLTTDVIPNAFHPLRTNPDAIALPVNLPANLLANRPDIIAARARTEAAAHEINVAKSRFFPNINLNALFSYQGVGLNHLFDPASQNNGITGALDLPIFDANARRANWQAKYARYNEAVGLYNQAILIALQEVANELTALQTLASQLAQQAASIQISEQQYKLMRSSYQHGILDAIPVLNIKQRWLQQQKIQWDLQTRYLQARVAMIKALGGRNHDNKNKAG